MHNYILIEINLHINVLPVNYLDVIADTYLNIKQLMLF